ncbi:IS66 family transposase zinc-finger binding domain-containing protein, partial [candidate division KSB1 bacterium]|nr:IS66 family transposase zinc-finger binding domain-containing protein [candidate division KSB1 bacterium]
MQTPEQIIIDELKRIVEMQAKQINLLIRENAQLKELRQRLEKLEAKKNSRNSSIPPSKDENRPKRTNSLREKSDKKVGGQPGHKGKTLEMTTHPDVVVDHRAFSCPDCGLDISHLPFELSSKRQIIEIPQIKQVVTEHRAYSCTCSCGKVVEGDFPDGVDWPVSYGQNIESLVGYLSARQHLPFKRLQEVMHDIFGVPISEGGLHCLLNRLAKKGTEAYEM